MELGQAHTAGSRGQGAAVAARILRPKELTRKFDMKAVEQS